MSGVCACTPESCSGCCAGEDCLDGTEDGACGSAGVACESCPANSTCQEQACTCVPGFKPCNGGCIPRDDCCEPCEMGQVCHAGSCCTPLTEQQACAGDACGAVSDGCSGTFACGGCPACHSCGADNTCEPVANRTACDGGICCNGTCCDGCCGTDGSCGACLTFVTDAYSYGDFGGVTDANARCATAATNAGLPGRYAAWISDSTEESAPANRFRHSGQPYKLLDGTTVADDWDDLVDGTLQYPINRNEHNEFPDVPLCAWTNTTPAGLRGSEFIECAGWTGGIGFGWIGSIVAPKEMWTKSFSSQCVGANTCRLYCFQQE